MPMHLLFTEHKVLLQPEIRPEAVGFTTHGRMPIGIFGFTEAIPRVRIAIYGDTSLLPATGPGCRAPIQVTAREITARFAKAAPIGKVRGGTKTA